MQASATSGGIDWEKRVDDVKVTKMYDRSSSYLICHMISNQVGNLSETLCGEMLYQKYGSCNYSVLSD